jgi:2-oxoglutarate dehydrogenase complex dehydrogenase (E1) component-like enzyme
MFRVSKYIYRKEALLRLSRAAFSERIPFNHNLQGFIQTYQKYGHKHAFLDPLNLTNALKKDEEFHPNHWELSEIEQIDSFPFDYR